MSYLKKQYLIKIHTKRKFMLPAIDFFESEDSLSHKYSGVGTPASLGKWMNKPVDLIYFDCCQVGNELEWFQKYFKAECAVSYHIILNRI
jgi:hypothetical protein